MHRTIVVSWLSMAIAVAGFFAMRIGRASEPASSATTEAAAPCEAPLKPPAGLLTQPFEDLQAIAQHFADQLGELKEQGRTVSPAELAEQAQAENGYAVKTTPDPGVKLGAEAVYAQARPGVVVVGGIYKCTKCQRWHAQCAGGFVVHPDGLIVTNLHVIEGCKRLEALGVMTEDGRFFPAKAVLASSRLNDLALLKVDATGLRPLPVAKDVPMGAAVYCLSHTGLPGGKSNVFYAFSQGIVCGKFTAHNDKQQSLPILAITAEYGPGSSGGPILNEHGAVVGIACQVQPVFKSEADKGPQLVWKAARPSSSILAMLSASGPRQLPNPAAVKSEPGPGAVTFDLRPRAGAMVNYYRPMRISLSAEPPLKPTAEPKYKSKKPLYGILELGEPPDNRFLVAVDEPEDGPPKLYIDRNGDRDLTNDGPGDWSRADERVLTANNVVIDSPYRTGKIPYRLTLYRFKTRLREALLYYRDCCREGEVTLDGQRYKIRVLDDNASGRFDHLDGGLLFIDLNQDGQLEGSPDSAEFYRLNEPFNVHGKVWEVVSLTPDGLWITLQPSQAQVPVKVYLTPGSPAPAFSGKGLDGQPVDLKGEAGRAKYVLVDFWASWCGPCRAEFPTLRRLYARYKDHGLAIIGVSLDSARAGRRRRQGQALLPARLRRPRLEERGCRPIPRAWHPADLSSRSRFEDRGS